MDKNTALKHGGRRLHCRHSTTNICAARSGITAKKTCMADAEAMLRDAFGEAGRLTMDATSAWGFPDAYVMHAAQQDQAAAMPTIADFNFDFAAYSVALDAWHKANPS